ncbi:MAG: CooT family nickel-binding protein [Anaerolineae bacterium]
MCQAKVFVLRDGQSELVAKDVIRLEEGEDGVSLSTFFEEPVLVRGRVVSIDFLKHTVTLSPAAEVTDGH